VDAASAADAFLSGAPLAVTGLVVALLLTGFVAGLFGSLLGLGGGWLAVPVLAALGLPAEQAVGTSLAAIVLTSASVVWRYHKRGILDLKLGLAFGVPALFGVELGRRLLARLSDLGHADELVSGLYMALLLFLAVTTLLKRGAEAPPPTAAPASPPRPPWAAGVAIGGAAGTLSGLLGIGGGIVMVPAMTNLLKLRTIVAVATSLIAVLVGSTFGALRNALEGQVHWGASAAIAAGAFVGGWLGASLGPTAPERFLKRLFAALALCVAAGLALKLGGQQHLAQGVLAAASLGLGLVAVVSLRKAKARAEAEVAAEA
jgi:uncharacterized membrane protein YfcA